MKMGPNTLANSRTAPFTASASAQIKCRGASPPAIKQRPARHRRGLLGGSLVDCHTGEGKLIFANGEFRGIFNNGKHVDGQFVFSDGLVYVEDDWKYCTSADRRLHSEMKE